MPERGLPAFGHQQAVVSQPAEAEAVEAAGKTADKALSRALRQRNPINRVAGETENRIFRSAEQLVVVPFEREFVHRLPLVIKELQLRSLRVVPGENRRAAALNQRDAVVDERLGFQERTFFIQNEQLRVGADKAATVRQAKIARENTRFQMQRYAANAIVCCSQEQDVLFVLLL